MEIRAGCASVCACETLIVSDVAVCDTLSFCTASALPASASAPAAVTPRTASLASVFIPLPFLLRNGKAPPLDARFPQRLSLIACPHEVPEELPVGSAVAGELDLVDRVVV